jgi:hypothetical protein
VPETPSQPAATSPADELNDRLQVALLVHETELDR